MDKIKNNFEKKKEIFNEIITKNNTYLNKYLDYLKTKNNNNIPRYVYFITILWILLIIKKIK